MKCANNGKTTKHDIERKYKMNTSENVALTVSESDTVSSLNKTKLMKLVIDLAEHMLACGGEVSRIEETVSRICTKYGAVKTDVFCITSVIIVTTIWDNEKIITQTRRLSQGSRNYSKLEMLNALSREICQHKLPLNEVEKRIVNITRKKHQSKLLMLLGSALAASGFAVFFGGTFIDALAAMICGTIIFLIDQYVYNSKMNKVVYYTICSFVVGMASLFLVRIGIGTNLDKIMIGCIMLLIPGLNLTTAIEDALIGDTATGALRIYESVVIACAIACGFALAVIFI